MTRWQQFGVALLATATAFVIRAALAPFLGEDAPLLAFILAVTLAASYGGWQSGAFAITLSVIAGGLFFIAPSGSLLPAKTSDYVRIGLFAGVGGVIVWQIEQKRRALTETVTSRSAESAANERTAALQEANRDLEAFGYSVSHDLRAPLRAVQGFGQVIEEDFGDVLPAQARDYLGRMTEAAERMDRLITDLLAYSRLSRADLRGETVALTEAVRAATVQVQAELQAVSAVLVIDDGLPSVCAHRATLVQMIANLLANAAKFVPPPTVPRIRVSAEQVTGQRIRFWVEDNGIGIDPAHRERIFHVFERLHGVETYPGTGIGLAIVRKGAERMNGLAGVESGKTTPGSRFFIELPGDDCCH